MPIRQRRRISGARPRGRPALSLQTSFALTPARLPSSQNVMAGKLVVGIGQYFDERDRGTRKRADHDAGEHEDEDVAAPAQTACKRRDNDNRQQAAAESEGLDADDR